MASIWDSPHHKGSSSTSIISLSWGVLIGASVGRDVGLGHLGVSQGGSVVAIVGSEVGIWVGRNVRTAACVGKGVGKGVGICVGLRVLPRVGHCVGGSVGESVGRSVGDKDGLMNGCPSTILYALQYPGRLAKQTSPARQ